MSKNYDLCAAEFAKLSVVEQQKYERIEPTVFAIPTGLTALDFGGRNDLGDAGKDAIRRAVQDREGFVLQI